MSDDIEGVIEYPFPLRPDCFVYLRFPRHLTRDEVGRVVAFLETLVVPEADPAVAGTREVL